MNYTYDDTDRPFFERVYDILVEHASAPKDPRDKETFVRAYTQREHRASEYRCCGAFGFGGKFWRNPGGGHDGCGFYVSCYPEDRNRKRDAQIAKLNERIAALVQEMRPAPDGPV